MNKSNILKNIKFNANFLLTISVLNGFTGFIMLTFIFKTNFIDLIFNNGFMLLILCLIEILWIGLSLCNSAMKRDIKLKDFKYILVVIPFFAISFIGQLGNSESFSCLFGDIGGKIYNTYIIIINVYILYLFMKKKK